MSSRKLVVGNWKMNPASLEDAQRIARRTRTVAARLLGTNVVACPPFPFILATPSRKPTANFHIGAQSVSVDDGGAHTGQVSAAMLRSIGVEYAIAGHSEERAAGDTDETVSRKIARILEAGMTAIVCVGENARGEDGAHFDFIKQQIKGTFAGIPAEKAARIILAYEPIWAIGAKDPMASADIYEMSIFVKKTFADIFGAEAGLKVKVLYGGAVNFRNAVEIIKVGQVDGLLVGRESVNTPGFVELLKAVDKLS
jgi:triosephosphate isomerase